MAFSYRSRYTSSPFDETGESILDSPLPPRPLHPQAWDSYNVIDLPNEVVALMVVSTTGDGEEPDNMRKAWRFLLRKSLPQGSLNRLRFGLFGLGDITYPKFNAVARRLQVLCLVRLSFINRPQLIKIRSIHSTPSDASQAIRRTPVYRDWTGR